MYLWKWRGYGCPAVKGWNGSGTPMDQCLLFRIMIMFRRAGRSPGRAACCVLASRTLPVIPHFSPWIVSLHRIGPKACHVLFLYFTLLYACYNAIYINVIFFVLYKCSSNNAEPLHSIFFLCRQHYNFGVRLYYRVYYFSLMKKSLMKLLIKSGLNKLTNTKCNLGLLFCW